MFKDTIYQKLTHKTKRIIQEFQEEPLRKIVYTSFDGDDMHHMLAMCDRVLKNNEIALNPEMALGYYISTETLGGKKVNVMTDCLTLTVFSDKLLVYGRPDSILSEGVMAEVFLWSQIKNKKAIFVPNVYSDEIIEMGYLELKEWLSKISDLDFRNEIYNNLLSLYRSQTHKTVYLGANFANYKHIDWARVHAYKRGLCPISPHNVLSYYLYHNVDDSDERYLKDRLTLLLRSDIYWLCIDSTNLETELNRLDQNTLAELYMLNNFYTEKEVRIVDWGEIGVPKYNKSEKWALTTREQEEILGHSWPLEFRK